MNTLKLTTAEQKKIVKAKKLIDEVLLLINGVRSSNETFMYDGNTNSLMYRIDGARTMVDDIVNDLS